MLPSWNPQSLEDKRPWVLGLIGGRRTGKSFMQAHLVDLFKKSFDLVISFSGSNSCSPELQKTIDEHFDPQLVFNKWNQKLVDKLLEQQYALKQQGKTRSVLILLDDIVLDSDADFSLANMAMRGCKTPGAESGEWSRNWQ